MAKKEELSSNCPHFFRIILPHILQNGTLELPRNFVQDHGKSLSNYVDLKLPTGAKSKIDLKYCDGRAWLDKGWRYFVGKYSIKCGYFLVFKYKGESRFNVMIFDLSTSEIDYPVSSSRTSSKKAEKRKLNEIKEEDFDQKDLILDKSPQKVQKGKGIKIEEHYKKLRSGKVFGGYGLDHTSARDLVLERANAYQSPNPRFIVKMVQSSSMRSYLHIPAFYARKYFSGRDDNGVIVKGPDGRAWSMEYCSSSLRSAKHSVRIFTGWRGFAKEYNLQHGDVCVFEMVDISVLTVNIAIFRVDIEDNGRRTRSQKKLKSSVLDV